MGYVIKSEGEKIKVNNPNGYCAENVGINVIITEKSYTSGTSFLDEELPCKEFYNKARRIYRGLFVSNTGRFINSDVNGSLQIMKKVFPNAFSHGIDYPTQPRFPSKENYNKIKSSLNI